MADQSNLTPLPGDRVRVTFEGVFADMDHGSVSFRHPDGPRMSVTWSDRLTPQVEILLPEFKSGDVAEYQVPNGSQTIILRMIFVEPAAEEDPYWFDSEGNRWWPDTVDHRRLMLIHPVPR